MIIIGAGCTYLAYDIRRRSSLKYRSSVLIAIGLQIFAQSKSYFIYRWKFRSAIVRLDRHKLREADKQNNNIKINTTRVAQKQKGKGEIYKKMCVLDSM